IKVRFRIRKQCLSLSESEFRPIIADNYYEANFFWFELDRNQTDKLISLFSSSPVGSGPSLSNHVKFSSLSKGLYISTKRNGNYSSETSNLAVACADQTYLGRGSSQNELGLDREKKRLEVIVSNNKAGNDEYEAGHTNQSYGHSYAYVVEYTSTINPNTDNSHTAAGDVNTSLPQSQKSWSSLFKSKTDPGTAKEPEDCKSLAGELSVLEWESSCVGPSCKRQLLEPPTDEAVVGKYDNGEGLISSVIGEADFSACHSESNETLPTTDTTQECGELNTAALDGDLPLNLERSLPWDLSCLDGESQFLKAPIENLGKDNHGNRIQINGNYVAETAVISETNLSELQRLVCKLLLEVEDLKSSKSVQGQRISFLEHELVGSKIEILHLRRRCKELEFGSLASFGLAEDSNPKELNSINEEQPDLEDAILVAGGFDGSSWLSSLDCYHPHRGLLRSLSSMSSVRSYGAAKLYGELYILGGIDGNSWHNTVDSYNPVSNRWVSRPPLNRSKGGLAGVSLQEKIFAIGGGNGLDYFAEVEMLDLNFGRWIPMRSILQKRFAAAAAEMNGTIYVVGGYDGTTYLNSLERFDPREHYSKNLGSMATRRGCHSLVVLNEKLYAIGGYDGARMVPTVEIFDPRIGSWMMGDSLNDIRGYFGAVVIGDGIYAIGGMKKDGEVLDTVEYYKEGHGWWVTDRKTLGKRCHFSSIVM
ncbi:kelch-like protein 12, partial [Tripterygium wilfordii]|uniref:kelch-like protein 12 n=1 Tax=Tripterygium wilfordii TaxID=458696 RepID=UPI0018F81C8B